MPGLALISLLSGAAILWIFRLTSDQEALRRTKNRLQAHLLELRLFGDEPSLVWRAQRELLLDNLRLIRLLLWPLLVLTIPMALLFVYLDALYGHRPLVVGQAAIVTLQMKRSLDPLAPPPILQAPGAIAVETPPVRILDDRQISWRVRPLGPCSGRLQIVFPDGAVEKTIQAGAGPKFLSTRRVSSILDLFGHPLEKPLRSGLVEWIEVRYPPADVSWFSLSFHWLVWFLLLSTASALLLNRRLRVSLI